MAIIIQDIINIQANAAEIIREYGKKTKESSENSPETVDLTIKNLCATILFSDRDLFVVDLERLLKHYEDRRLNPPIATSTISKD